MAQVRSLADIVDQAGATGDTGLEIRTHSLLSKLLTEVSATPKARMQLELRSRRVEQGTLSATVASAPNVTAIASKRPVPRPR